MSRKYPLKIGITGGIGSGKSVVCRLFSMLGAAVYDSDSRARGLMEADAVLSASIRRSFGEESYNNGHLNRSYLAGRVFGDGQALALLNSLVHPAVTDDFLKWAAVQQGSYVIAESAILYESGMNACMDATVTVSAPEELRIERVMLRDGSSRREAESRIRNQMSDALREELARYVIYNDGRLLVWPQVLSLDSLFRCMEG